MKQFLAAVSVGLLWSSALSSGLTMAGWCQGLHMACIPVLPFWIATIMALLFPAVVIECVCGWLLLRATTKLNWLLPATLVLLIAMLQAEVGYISGGSLGAL